MSLNSWSPGGSNVEWVSGVADRTSVLYEDGYMYYVGEGELPGCGVKMSYCEVVVSRLWGRGVRLCSRGVKLWVIGVRLYGKDVRLCGRGVKL